MSIAFGLCSPGGLCVGGDSNKETSMWLEDAMINRYLQHRDEQHRIAHQEATRAIEQSNQRLRHQGQHPDQFRSPFSPPARPISGTDFRPGGIDNGLSDLQRTGFASQARTTPGPDNRTAFATRRRTTPASVTPASSVLPARPWYIHPQPHQPDIATLAS